MKKTIMSLVIFLAMITSVYATTCTTTCDTSTLSQSENLVCNATISHDHLGTNNTNFTAPYVEMKSTLADRSTWTIVKNDSYVAVENQWVNVTSSSWITGTEVTLNITIPLTNLTDIAAGFLDATDYEVRVVLNNVSADAIQNEVNCTATTATILVDAYKPSCSVSGITTNTIYYKDTVNTVTVTSNATSGYVELFFNSDTVGTSTTASAWSANSRTHTYDMSGQTAGTYDVFARCYDGTNETQTSTVETVQLVSRGGGGGGGGGGGTSSSGTQAITTQAIKPEQVKEGLTRKVGPLPLWVWGLIVLGFVFRKKLFK